MSLKFILIGFVLISILFTVAMVSALIKVAGYWSKKKKKEDLKKYYKMEFKDREYHE